MWLTARDYVPFPIPRGKTTAPPKSQLSTAVECSKQAVVTATKMDPLTALGLVSNILSVISFGHELVTSTRELYSSSSADGVSERVREQRAIVADVRMRVGQVIQYLSPNPKRTPGPILFFGLEATHTSLAKKDRECLVDIAANCDHLISEATKIFDSLEMKHKSGLLKFGDALKVSVRASRKKSAIAELQSRLLLHEGRLCSWWRDQQQRFVLPSRPIPPQSNVNSYCVGLSSCSTD